jgi:hypothetical protein
MPRRLNLRREALTDLTTDELAEVAGAAAHTVPDPECLTEMQSVGRKCPLTITSPCAAP